MTKDKELLSSEYSPVGQVTSGVRRVNNIPLIIAFSACLLFVLVIALVAVKRSNQQDREEPEIKSTVVTDSSAMAKEIVANYQGGIIPSATPAVSKVERLELPVAVIDNPDNPPIPMPNMPEMVTADDAEITRIRQQKIQDFEEAVKAKTKIELPVQTIKSMVNPTDVLRVKQMESINKDLQEMDGSDSSLSFQTKLLKMQGMMSGQEQRKGGMELLSIGGSEEGDRWSLHSSVEAPRSRYELRAGAVLPGTMISGIRSDLPGQIIGQIAQDVYDTATGKYLLIPQGTRCLGVYSSEVSYGQNVVLVAWQRLIFPDGKVLDIGSMPGANSAGFAGFNDKTNNHYMRTFGSALLMSGIIAGVTYSQNQSQLNNGIYTQPTAGSVLSQALGQQLGEVTAQMISKNLNIAPTLEIRAGYQFNITITKDLKFKKPYQSFDY